MDDSVGSCDSFKTKIDSLLEGDEKNLVILEREKHQRQEDYIQIMKDCRKKRTFPIVVYGMKKEDFVSTKKLEKEIVNRKKTCSGEAINWLHIREIKLIKEERFSIFIKTVHNIRKSILKNGESQVKNYFPNI